MASRPDEHRIAELAGAQLGLITRAQLHACGVGRGAISGRIGRGALRRLEAAVYEVGRPVEHPLAPLLAGTLSVPAPAWLCGSSAGAVWDVLPGAVL